MGDKPFDLKMRFALITTLSATSLLMACATATPRAPSDAPGPLDTFVVLEQPPIIEIKDEREIKLVELRTARLDAAALADRPDARRVATEALPFLNNSPTGKRFLVQDAPRAFFRGSPPELCPAVGMAGGTEARDLPTAAVMAATRCLDALGDAAGDGGCGCRMIAANGVVTSPREDLVYATGTSARIRSDALGLDALIVAEDLGDGDTLLRDLRGPVGLLRHLPDNDIEMVLVGNENSVFRGTALPVGFRRGRVAERIYARDDEGRAVSLLIGFSPEELAGRAGAWLAGPPSG
jgi:hypothetical protein